MPTSASLCAVPSEQGPAVLDAVGPQVRKALLSGQGDGTTLGTVVRAILDGDMGVWAVHDGSEIKAALVLSVTRHATGRKVFVELIAGRDMDEWSDEVEQALQDFRDVLGAMCVEASCRPGLARYLKRRGWTTKAVIMEAP